MRIAVVGSGISGLADARALDGRHDVTVFEQDDRLGGHACTVDVDHYGPRLSVDVGFIIFNRFTYPRLVQLFRDLGVKSTPTRMAFSISLDEGRFEWSTGTANAIFAQRANLLSLKHYKLLLEVLRFFRVVNADLAGNTVGEVSLRDYLARHRFSSAIVERFLVPMGASIWSASGDGFLEHPAEVLFAFMKNHRLLSVKQPVWLTVSGGSRTYVTKIEEELRGAIRPGVSIVRVARGRTGVTVVDSAGNENSFDHVILACHAPDALRLLDSPTIEEREILGALNYSRNLTVLHGDASLMPKRRNAWGSWNYISDSARSGAPVCITYWMNNLQHIDEKYPLFVTLNPVKPPRADLVFASFDFEHPQFDRAAVNAQKRLASLQGRGNVWFCGAYAGHGFHEDGIRSGLEAADAITRRGQGVPEHAGTLAQT